ncbi:hypothetical protein BRYFOR_05712 [Marvinbryantia formatexigens DSM 14469]|nr:hypothetical protein BRYFOR_05712 [Marvinbryantia formatexigens DSM 14469]
MWWSAQFQSTLPRGERQINGRYLDVRMISIHAPARGATTEQGSYYCANTFQSTLPRGERRCICWRACCRRDFNPRSREGSDTARKIHMPPVMDFNPRSREGSDRLATLANATADISIHAPARGATGQSPEHVVVFIFQSTLPRGERRKCLLLMGSVGNFNPRSREGSDLSAPYKYQRLVISIHAPARGATTNSSKSIHVASISIHAPARGATLISCAPVKI